MSQTEKALLPTPVSECLTAIFRDTPFNVPGEYHEVQVPAGLTLQEIIDRLADAWKQDYLCVILNDVNVPKDQWPLTVPHKDDVLNIILVPKDGDAGAILKAVAVIAVVVAVSWALGPAGPLALGQGAGYAALAAGVGAAAGLATSLALNALFPPPVATPTALTGSGLAEDSVYGFSATSNSLKPYSVIPRLYGRRMLKPDWAIKPYIVSNGSTQYLYQAFDLGYGPLQVEDIKIGETPIANFPDVEIVVHESFQAGDPLSFINQDVWQDPYSIKLTQGLETKVESTDNAEKLVIDLQFPNGLFWLDSSDGNYNAEAVAISLKIRKVGTPSWLWLGELNCSVNGADVQGGNLVVNRKTQKPFFVTVSITLPEPGKYEILPVRLSEDREGRESNKSYDIVYLASVQSIRNVAPIAPPVPITLIELRAKATDRFNGAIADLSCIATSKLPVYRNGTWVVEATRNPAWCVLSAMRGAESKKPIPDKRIILPDFIEWGAWCDSDMPSAPGQPRACCDLIISGKTTQWDALQTISATGYATPTRAGFRYTVAVDRMPTKPPVQMFLPENIKDLEGTISYHEQPHALRVQYSPTDSMDSDEVVVFDDGYSADGANGTQVATIYETMDLVGIGRYQQAWVMGRRSLAQGRLRIEDWSFSVDYERMLCRRGSYVRFAHNLPMIGSGTGRITRVDGQTIRISKALELTGTIYCIVRTSQNVQKNFSVQSYTEREMVLVGDMTGIEAGNTVAFGNLSRIAQDCFVKKVSSAGKALGAKLELIPLAPGIYTADTDPIPPYEAMLPPQTGGTSGGGSTGVGSASTTPGPVQSLQAGVFITYNQGAPKISVSLSWSAPVTGRAVSYQVYHWWNGAWQLRSTVYDTTALAYSEYTFLDEAGRPVNMNGTPMQFSVVGVNGDGAALPPELGAKVTVTPRTDDPATIDTLATAGGAFCIILRWALQTNGFDAAHVEIWGSQTNDRATATLMAVADTSETSWQLNGLGLGARYYFWIRVVDGAGNKSAWYPQNAVAGVAGMPMQDAGFLLDQLDKSVGLNQLADELARPIGLIDPLKFKVDWELGNVNIQRLAEKVFDDAERAHSSAQVLTEAAARAGADEAAAVMIREVSARLDTGDYAVVKETIEASASALQGVTARYLLQVDANGHVAAISLQSDEAASSMVFLADKFLMARPDGSGAQPMMQLAVVNGQTVLGLNGTLIGNDGIFTGKIVGGELVGTTGTFAGKVLAGVVDMTSLIGSSYTFGTPGWQTLYVPEGYTSMRVTALGAGGGGGSASYGEWNTTRARGGGGRAGAYVIQAWDNLAVGAAISIYVGNAGLGATEWQQAGYNGEATFVNYNGTRLITAAGGAGGGFAEDYDNQSAAIATGRVPVNGLGIGGAPGLVGDGNYGSPVWTAGFNASGYGAGGGGGGNSGRQGANAGGSPDKYNQWAGGGKGSGGRIIVEFYNPNAVVLRTEFTALQNRVAALEAR